MIKDYSLTVVVVNYNAKEFLCRCLESVYEANLCEGNTEVIVVDNGSTDGSKNMVQNDFPQTKLLKSNVNVGYGRGANLALRDIYSKYVLLLNSDTRLFPRSIETMIEFAERNQDMGLLGPMLINPDGTLQFSCRRFPSFLVGTMHAFLGWLFPNNRCSRYYKLADWHHRTAREVDWVSGACLFLRQEVAKTIGLFDERYFMYGEDMDLCFRIKQAGWKVYYLPDAKVIHYIGRSSGLDNPKMIIEHHKSIYRFFSKQYLKFPRNLLRYVILVGLLVRAALLLSLVPIKRLLGGRERNTSLAEED